MVVCNGLTGWRQEQRTYNSHRMRCGSCRLGNLPQAWSSARCQGRPYLIPSCKTKLYLSIQTNSLHDLVRSFFQWRQNSRFEYFQEIEAHHFLLRLSAGFGTVVSAIPTSFQYPKARCTATPMLPASQLPSQKTLHNVYR